MSTPLSTQAYGVQILFRVKVKKLTALQVCIVRNPSAFNKVTRVTNLSPNVPKSRISESDQKEQSYEPLLSLKVTVAACLEGVLKIQFLKDQQDLSGGINSFLLHLRKGKAIFFFTENFFEKLIFTFSEAFAYLCIIHNNNAFLVSFFVFKNVVILDIIAIYQFSPCIFSENVRKCSG